MADILDKRPMNAEMTIFKTEVNPDKLNVCIDNILMRVNRLETKFSDVQPMKCGKWRKAEQGYDTYVECSECGLNLEMSNYVGSEWREILKYCPCCGARMDLKEGDAE